ncbi:MAG: DUF4349 domain-containing protein [Sphingobacteriaceae bacterium]|nr:DUF4349 domain-containing protein [Sphingobacteriaceae bacterium]
MKTISKIYLLGLVIALMQGCGADREAKSSNSEADMISTPAGIEKSKDEASEEGITNGLAGNSNFKDGEKRSADTNKMNFVNSSASRIGKIDSIKKFIRTADIKFKVKNVEKSTYKIEDIINHFDGFVINTNLNCRVNYTESHRIKEDSVLERKHFVVENSITFRVPKFLLDTTLKQIVSQIDFLDHRIITAEDVSFAALKNKMHQKRFGRYQKRITQATDRSGKTNAVVNAENGLYEKEELADNSELNDMVLNDKVEYATVTMYIYQDEKVRNDMVFSQPHFDSYRPSFGSEFVKSLKFGWRLVEEIFLLIVKLWPIILIGIGLFYGIRRLVKKA